MRNLKWTEKAQQSNVDFSSGKRSRRAEKNIHFFSVEF